MTILTRLRAIRLLALGMLLILPAASGAQQRPPILEKLTKTYGLESFGQIEAIRYTFNVEAAGLNVSRSWTWEPKTYQVTYEGKDKSGNPVKVTYRRSQLGSQPANVRDDIDPGFLNDNYWLLLPFHLSWDSNAAVGRLWRGGTDRRAGRRARSSRRPSTHRNPGFDAPAASASTRVPAAASSSSGRYTRSSLR